MPEGAAQQPKEATATRRRNPPRDLAPSAQAFADWVDVLFAVAGRLVRAALPLAIFVLAAVELVTADSLGPRHISSELAQTLLGASIGAFAVDLFAGRGRRR